MNDLDVFPVTPEIAGPETARPKIARDDRRFVYGVARRIVGSANDADDVTQDALLLAFRHRAAFRGDASYRGWLYRIASTTAISFLRRRRRSREHLAGGELEALRADDADSPEARVARRDTMRFVRRAIDGLEPRYRDVLLCREDASETDTAERLGISRASVKIRAFRARQQLRGVLAAVR